MANVITEKSDKARPSRNNAHHGATVDDSQFGVSDTPGRLPYPKGVEPKKIHWGYSVSFLVIHIAALLIFLPYCFSWVGFAAFVLGVCIFGQLGIPICYHRQLAHRSFKTPKWLERTMVTFALCSAQETPARWVAWHRLHHKHSDQEGDPHSPLVNFVWSHTWWLVYQNREHSNFSMYQKHARDILEDPYYMWLEKIWMPMLWFFLGHAAIYAIISYTICATVYGIGPEALQLTASLFVWGVLARTVWVWHITWSVNSLAHVFGYRNYETSDGSRNNWLVTLLTAGEGWHNNHHADQSSASVQHRWWEIDLNYYVICMMGMVGLASNIVPPRHKRQAARGAKPTSEPKPPIPKPHIPKPHVPTRDDTNQPSS